MTIRRSLLTRGYFPKELPPEFFTEQFAQYATSKHGRSIIESYRNVDGYSECTSYRLALPGAERRELRIPHPAYFAKLVSIGSVHFSRLLKKASASKFSKSRPVYETQRQRAIHPMVKPSNLPRERAAIRAGASFLLKADVSQFYPSLYTHAVGWAVDPKLRLKAHWKDWSLLGKKLDQALMDMDGKISQGIPTGNDVSFLLAEVVLAQVDKALKVPPDRSFRWFDDYEIACDSISEAEDTLKRLTRELSKFRLRLNPAKTTILPLPKPIQDEWQESLKQAGACLFTNPNDMVRYFDTAFRLRDNYRDVPILMYASGILFKVRCPSVDVGRIAQSGITQALLCEPGVAQKAFALLTFWKLNGFEVDLKLVRNTIDQMVLRHQATGLSSDVAWALAFCLEHKIPLGQKASEILSTLDDDCTAILALDMNSRSLLHRGFKKDAISKALKNADLDREHWLIAYESVRHNFLAECTKLVKSHPLFSELLKTGVTFYRRILPAYSLVLHPGSAPEWVVRSWMEQLGKKNADRDQATAKLPLFRLIEKDFKRLDRQSESLEALTFDLLDVDLDDLDLGEDDMYSI